MLKAFRVALLSTGIGAIVVALGALVTFLTSTQKGVNAVNKVLIPLRTIMQSLLGVVEDVGERIFDAFSNPKQAVSDLWEAIKTNLVNRVTAVGGIFKALGKIISSGFTDGYRDLADASLQAVTGVEDVIDKTKQLLELLGSFSVRHNGAQRLQTFKLSLAEKTISKCCLLRESSKANKIAEDQSKTLEEEKRQPSDQLKCRKI